MTVIGTRPVLAAALLLSGLWMPAAFAYTSGHSGGSGGHVSAGHAGMAHAGGAHFAAHTSAPRSFVGSRATYVGAARIPPTHWATAGVGHGAIAARTPGLRARPVGPGYGHTSHWGGGYWGGRYWPAAYYRPGFVWFLASVPLYCSTYWWNDVPYYYYNDVYYSWSPTADGYVATDPPPAAPAEGGAAASAPSDASAAPDAIPPGGFASGGPSIYAYPAKGQSEQQQATDRAECTQWAATQTGGAVGSPDYRRAAIACFEGRGYSAQ